MVLSGANLPDVFGLQRRGFFCPVSFSLLHGLACCLRWGMLDGYA